MPSISTRRRPTYLAIISCIPAVISLSPLLASDLSSDCASSDRRPHCCRCSCMLPSCTASTAQIARATSAAWSGLQNSAPARIYSCGRPVCQPCWRRFLVHCCCSSLFPRAHGQGREGLVSVWRTVCGRMAGAAIWEGGMLQSSTLAGTPLSDRWGSLVSSLELPLQRPACSGGGSDVVDNVSTAAWCAAKMQGA